MMHMQGPSVEERKIASMLKSTSMICLNLFFKLLKWQRRCLKGPEETPARTWGAPYLAWQQSATATARPAATRPPTPSLTRTSSAPSGLRLGTIQTFLPAARNAQQNCLSSLALLNPACLRSVILLKFCKYLIVDFEFVYQKYYKVDLNDLWTDCWTNILCFVMNQ